MDYNLENDYPKLETKQDSFGSKMNKQKKLSIFVIFLMFIVCLIYGGIKISNSNIITITSKDGIKKMSLMKNDRKYRGSNSCPKGYHIPTLYEWVEALKLWCENHPKCDTKDIDTSSNYGGWGTLYARAEVVDDFFHDFNIHLNRGFDFGIGFHKEKHLGLSFNYGSVCESLGFFIVGKDRDIMIEPQPSERCRKPKYVRCFSDENITSESINEESFTSDYGLERTKFEIGTYYSGRKFSRDKGKHHKN